MSLSKLEVYFLSVELYLLSWNISNWRYHCLTLAVSKKIYFCIYTFKMLWCSGDDHGHFFYNSSTIWGIETSVQLRKFPYKHFPDKIPLWSFSHASDFTEGLFSVIKQLFDFSGSRHSGTFKSFLVCLMSKQNDW